jgi:hypothetical protein
MTGDIAGMTQPTTKEMQWAQRKVTQLLIRLHGLIALGIKL